MGSKTLAHLAARKHARSDEAKVQRRLKARAARRKRAAARELERAARRRARRLRGEVTCYCDAYPFPHRKGSEGAPSSGSSQELAAARAAYTERDRMRRLKSDLQRRRARSDARRKRARRAAFSFLPF